jgi:formate dehydrogenase subunit beta
MTTQWILHTQGDPLGAVRRFLGQLFQNAGLDGMLVLVYEPESDEAKPRLVDDSGQLQAAAPFAPVMTTNLASAVADLKRQSPGLRLGAVLRPCEVRALREVARRDSVEIAPYLIIGVDCIGTLTIDDDGWRDDLDQLTRKALKYARQGGMAMYRCRPACQMCLSPVAAEADVSIGILGLPIRQVVLITARDERLARALQLDAITAGKAEPALVAQHDEMRATLIERRNRTRERMIHALSTDLAMDVDGLIAHLRDCQPCQQCLEACPICGSGESLYAPDGSLLCDAVIDWLMSCAGCGMCEQVCPEHLPFTAIVRRISHELAQALDGAPDQPVEAPLTVY